MSFELRTADSIDGRIVWVRNDQRKLGASVPTLFHAFGICVIEIDRDGVIWGSVGIAEREEKYPPGGVFRLRKWGRGRW